MNANEPALVAVCSAETNLVINAIMHFVPLKLLVASAFPTLSFYPSVSLLVRLIAAYAAYISWSLG